MTKQLLIRILLAAITPGIHFQLMYAQKEEKEICLRVSGQIDLQKVKTTYGPPETISANAANFGADLLYKTTIYKKLFVQGGIGYFRNRFNLKRAYNHQLLNPTTDSLPVLTKTSNYTYSIMRLPIGVGWKIKSKNGKTLEIGLEYLFNFSYKQKYNGGKPFPNANDKLEKFKYHGSGLDMYFSYKLDIGENNCLAVQPYVRIFNNYKSDIILEEIEKKTISKAFDSYGLSVYFSFKH